MSIDLIAQFIVSGLTMGSIYALIGLGYNLIFNTTDVINFAQGEFVMMGGLLSVIIAMDYGLPLMVAVPVATILVGCLGALINVSIINRVRGGSVMTLVMITLGLSVVIKTTALLIAGPNPLYLKPFSSQESFHLGSVVLQTQSIWVLIVSLVLMALLGAFFRFTSLGRDMLACAIDREAAKLMGINVKRVVLISFFLSGSIGAIAGAMVAPISNVTYDMGLTLSLNAFAALALGGLGSSVGAILGGFLLGLIQSLSLVFVPSGWKESVGLAILVLVLLFRPSGILGGRQERRHTEAMN